ncbi:MAG: UDP-N-acetylmuramoyl-tripeptide--D-alanyl-D-alanine ligase [Verrucomicrobiota bacterium]
MTPTPLHLLAERCGGLLLSGPAGREIARVGKDTRDLRPGDLYVALKGERFDGHAFLPQAAEAGAAAALVSEAPEAGLPADFGLIKVADTLVGLQTLAGDYRRRLSARTVGVTGSSGKTSTKEMIASVLRQKFATRATQGNLNNHIGVPLTVLSLEEGDAWGVVEMGMNHPGEIRPLARMAAPFVGVVTNIGSAHIEFFEDRSGIAQEKSELLMALPENGLAVFPAQDDFAETLRARTQARVVTVGEGGDWQAERIEVTTSGIDFDLVGPGGRARVSLPLFSRPMVSNALLAAAVGAEAGLSLEEIAAGLAAVELPGQRMKVSQLEDGRWVINDAYNANADSMRASLQALMEMPSGGRKTALLGSMGELGARSAELHRQVGRDAAELGVDALIVMGPAADDMRAGALEGGLDGGAVAVAASHDEAGERLSHGFKTTGDCLLVKGSRFMKLEEIVTQLESATKQETT